MGKDSGRQLHPDTDVHTVGACGNLQILADLFHPLAPAAAHRDDALTAGVSVIFCVDCVTLFKNGNRDDGGIKEELHLVLQVGIEVFQHHIVDIRAQVADGGIQQMQVILDAQSFEPGTGGGVELGALSPEAQLISST